MLTGNPTVHANTDFGNVNMLHISYFHLAILLAVFIHQIKFTVVSSCFRSCYVRYVFSVQAVCLQIRILNCLTL